MDLGSLGFVVDSEKLYQEKVEAEAKVTKRNSVENGSNNIQSPWRKRKKNSGEHFLVSKLDSSRESDCQLGIFEVSENMSFLA